MQHTLKNKAEFKGKGLHSGETITMHVMPADIDQGINFIRQDVKDKNNLIAAKWNNVEASQLCTLLKNNHGVEVRTVEHLMAAFAGLGIDNATVILDGGEVPIMDGSAMPFIDMFERVGLLSQKAERPAIRILKTVEVPDEAGRFARFEPDVSSVFEFTIDFDNSVIGKQSHVFELMDASDFKDEIANCRTFTRLVDVDMLMNAGLIKGGGLDNAVVFDAERVLNPEGLRRFDEPVRHKILDAIGDVYLAGAPIIGRFICEKGGHALTNLLLRELFADDLAYTFTTDYLGIGVMDAMSACKKPAYNA
jgi:UDP-3-O-[3-hydroxymyristoyl] N-acetylglucosamine deacetylase